MPNIKTRRRTSHFCLGQPASLPQKSLPTEADVYNATVHKRQEFNLNLNNNSKTDIYKEVAKPEQTFVRKVTKVCDNAKVLKSYKKEELRC